MKYIYHYHLIQLLKDGSQNHQYGVLTRTAPIDSDEQYKSAIAYICESFNGRPEKCIVSSLSLLSHPA